MLNVLATAWKDLLPHTVSLALRFADELATDDAGRRNANGLARLIFGKKDMKAYRTQLLTPLRKELRLVETRMCAGNWNDINFEAVPSRAHKILHNAFERHLAAKYAAYLKKVEEGKPITWLTGYDYPTAYMQDQAGIDMILVGDSLGMTMLGYDSTLPVTMEDMICHAAAVRRGAPNVWLVGGMPYMTYQPSVESAIRNAGRFMAEAGCDCIKLEGGVEMADRIAGIVRAGIPAIGHLGLTPQSVAALGGFKLQGNSAASATPTSTTARTTARRGICAATC